MADNIVSILIQAKDEATEKINGISQRIDKVDTDLRKIGVGMMGVGTGIAVALGMAVKAAAAEEAGIARLSTAMNAVGITYEGATGKLEQWISATQRAYAFADDQLRTALSQLIPITNDVGMAQRLLATAMDLARWKGMDLAQATLLIGKVYQGNTETLARYGIQIKEGASATEALSAIQAAASGQAKAYGDSAAGAMDKLSMSMSDLKEAVGGALLPTIQPLIERFTDLIETIQKTDPAMLQFVVQAAAVTSGILLIGGGLLTLVSTIPSVVAGFRGLAVILGMVNVEMLAIAAAGVAAAAALYAIQWGIGKLSGYYQTDNPFEQIKVDIQAAIGGMKDMLPSAESLMEGLGSSADVSMAKIEAGAKKAAQGVAGITTEAEKAKYGIDALSQGWDKLERNMAPAQKAWDQFNLTTEDLVNYLAVKMGRSVDSIIDEFKRLNVEVNDARYILQYLKMDSVSAVVDIAAFAGKLKDTTAGATLGLKSTATAARDAAGAVRNLTLEQERLLSQAEAAEAGAGPRRKGEGESEEAYQKRMEILLGARQYKQQLGIIPIGYDEQGKAIYAVNNALNDQDKKVDTLDKGYAALKDSLKSADTAQINATASQKVLGLGLVDGTSQAKAYSAAMDMVAASLHAAALAMWEYIDAQNARSSSRGQAPDPYGGLPAEGRDGGLFPSMSFADGGYVPRTGLALVHQGEYVIPNGGGSASPTIHVYLDSDEVTTRVLRRVGDRVALRGG